MDRQRCFSNPRVVWVWGDQIKAHGWMACFRWFTTLMNRNGLDCNRHDLKPSRELGTTLRHAVIAQQLRAANWLLFVFVRAGASLQTSTLLGDICSMNIVVGARGNPNTKQVRRSLLLESMHWRPRRGAGALRANGRLVSLDTVDCRMSPRMFVAATVDADVALPSSPGPEGPE